MFGFMRIRPLLAILPAILLVLLCKCDVSETTVLTSVHLTINDSLDVEAGKYSSVRVDIYNGDDSLIYPALFNGPYVKTRDSAKLADLALGENPPDPMKIVITGYKGDIATLRIVVNVQNQKAAPPILTILVHPTPTQVKPEKLVISDSMITLGYHGETQRIYAVILPDSAEGQVRFSSDNLAVATIDQEGIISPLDSGTALIRAEIIEDTSLFDTVRVRVIVPAPIQSIAIQKPMPRLFVGAPATPITLLHTPDSLTLIPVFESSDEDVIRVINGAAKALNPGFAIITVRPAGVSGLMDTIRLEAVKDVPFIDAGLDQSVAVGESVTFKVKVTQEYGHRLLSWDFDDDQIPEGTVSTDTATATYTYEEAGDYKVVFTAEDIEGNVVRLSRRIRVGKTGPLITITKPRNDTLVGDPEFTVEYLVDTVPASQPFHLEEGLNLLHIVATNANGSDTVIVKVTLDTKPPVVRITSPSNGLITRLPEIPVEWTVDSVAQETRRKETLTGKQGALWIVRDWVDSAGNRGADSVQIVRDTIPPSAPTFLVNDTVTNHPRPQWTWQPGNGGNGTFTLQFGDEAEVITTDTIFTPTTDLGDGTYTLKVREHDAAGNLSPWRSRTIQVKTSGPNSPSFDDSLTSRSPTRDKTPTWSWISSGTQGGGSGIFKWSVNTPIPDSGEGRDTQFTPVVDLPDGAYALTLRERDALGNWSAPVTREIRILTQGASVKILSPAPNTYSKVRNGLIAVEWSVNGAKQQSQTTQTLTQEGAWNLIRREYTDSALNVTFDTVSVFWDTTAPKVVITYPTQGMFFTKQTLAVNWTVDGIPQTTDTVETLSAGNGSKTFTRTARDAAGNTDTAWVTVTLDTSGFNNPPVKSEGCGKALSIATGRRTIISSGNSRDYSIDIPQGYDPNTPHRLIFCFHWLGGTDTAVAYGRLGGDSSVIGPDNYAFYGLKLQAEMANQSVIFIAPRMNGSTWQAADHVLFDDLLTFTRQNLCVDTTRVFATGFSIGAMFTYSLSTNHQDPIRAAIGYAPVNYNIYLPPKVAKPIAWMSTTGMSDATCPWIVSANNKTGAKFIALEKAADNGCNIPADIPTTTTGSKTHLCYDFSGCTKGYPVKTCTFDGNHQSAPGDGGTKDVGKNSWVPAESWKFFSQF